MKEYNFASYYIAGFVVGLFCFVMRWPIAGAIIVSLVAVVALGAWVRLADKCNDLETENADLRQHLTTKSQTSPN